MENPTALITDSTCDVPQVMIDRYGITVIPQIVVWGKEPLRDRVDLLPEDFHLRLEKDAVRPTSIMPSPGDFEKAFQDAIANGAKEIVVMVVRSAMSGTYQIAEQVGRRMNVPVHVELLINITGPVLGIHTGPHALALCGYSEENSI